jgi:hypothetical protein
VPDLLQSSGVSFDLHVPFGAMILTAPELLLTQEWMRLGLPPWA